VHCVCVGAASVAGTEKVYKLRFSLCNGNADQKAELRNQLNGVLISSNKTMAKRRDDILNTATSYTCCYDLLAKVNSMKICEEIIKLETNREIEWYSGTSSNQTGKLHWTYEELFKVKRLAAELDIKKVRYKIPRVGSDFLCSVLTDIMPQALTVL